MATDSRRTIGLIVLLVSLLIFGFMVWRTTRLIDDGRRLNPVTRPGPPDQRGFRFIAVHPESGRPVRYNPCVPLRY
ncbi:MAG: hypothetical protein LC808_27630, partial [Actinobacteria bacterium]|nr:hypothetical protein [Actinomycetota bacterium]